jgi:pre-mRNA-splicing helicase BRR2
MGDGENGVEDGAEIDDRQGVAVVFDDNSEDEDGQEMVNEVRDESSEDEARRY